MIYLKITEWAGFVTTVFTLVCIPKQMNTYLPPEEIIPMICDDVIISNFTSTVNASIIYLFRSVGVSARLTYLCS